MSEDQGTIYSELINDKELKFLSENKVDRTMLLSFGGNSQELLGFNHYERNKWAFELLKDYRKRQRS